MVGKNNQYIQKIKQGTKVETYSIKKFKVGIASVAIGCSVFFGAGVAMAGEQISGEQAVSETTISKDTPKTESKPDTETVTEKQTTTTKVEHNATQPNTISEEKEKETEKPKAVVNTKKLEDLLSEIDKLNLSNYTEESVKVLQEKVAQAKEVLTNAKTQKEINSSYNALVSYKNSGLKRVPKLKEGETPKPDTTNGKETLGKKAGNTEPNGTNIAGHNHSMNRTSLPEGSGFRAVPAGDVTFYKLDGSMETEAGRAPNARYILKVRKGQGYRPQYTSATTTGAYLDYRGSKTEGDFVLYTYETRGSDGAVGTYDFRLKFTDSKTSEVYVNTILKVNVKPNKPTVTVENLEKAAGKRAVVKSTARNSNDSIVKFYLNGTEKATIPAVNGTASWTPDEALQAGDRITTRNIARDRESIPATYGGDINVERSTSDLSDAVTIPTPPTPVLDKNGAINEINELINEKNSQVDSSVALTNEEKKDIKDKMKAEADKAIENIKKDTTNTAELVNKFKEEGKTAINAVTFPSKTKKDEAIEAVITALTTKDQAIDGNNDLTTEEKTAGKEAVKTKADAAIKEINEATTNATVETAKTNGVSEINKVTATGTKKAEAIKEVEAAQKTKDQAIDGNNDLTTEEKTEVKKQTAKAKEDAVNAINAATTNAQVASEKDAGITAINGVALPAEPEKAKAIAEIKVALEAKEKATDEDKSLTKGQKTSIKEIAKKEAMAATVKIKSATTNKEVEEAKNEGIEKIKAAYAKNAELAAELTLPKLIITKWEDEEGNELRQADAKAPAEPGGANEALAHGEIAGYEFVATRGAGEVVTHIFRKLPKKSPIVEERQLPVVEKVNTKAVLPNTGANTTNTGLAGLGLSVLGAVLMTARQRRKNK